MASPLVWVHPETPLPEAETALTNPPGLVAAGTDLGVARLIEAYRKGIFPWYSKGDPVLWWSPDPRMVLFTEELHISKSLQKKLKQIKRHQQQNQFDAIVTTDMAFDAVLEGCASRGQPGTDTWITADMKQAYQRWHAAGDVHSIETWINGQLAGGLYGVCLGRMFFGESMFTLTPNASKIALVHLVRFLEHRGIKMIDCQMQTEHLASLGARAIERTEFLRQVRQAVDEPGFIWSAGWIDDNGQCHAQCPAGVELKVTEASLISYDQYP